MPCRDLAASRSAENSRAGSARLRVEGPLLGRAPGGCYKARMLLSTTLRLFLDGIGRRDEYEYYLRKFQSAPGACFAAVVPDEASMRESVEAIVFDLHFLLRLELTPAVVLCGPAANGAASAMAAALPSASVRLDVSSGDAWAGRVEESLACARAQRGLLMIAAPDRGPADTILPLIPSTVRRVQWLRARGPYRDTRGRKVPLHLLHGQNDHELSEADRRDDSLALAARALALAPTLHISVAAPLDLLAELFTVRGKGTAIRRGSVIVRHAGLAGVDQPRLVALFQEAFGRPLSRPESLRLTSDAYIEEAYRGAALIEPHPAGAYLSKFAVGTQARGEGLAQELWSLVRRRHPALFWRSRPDNPINGWYDQQADGRLREEPWHIFWRGLRADDIPSIVDYCRRRPPDFAAPAAGE